MWPLFGIAHRITTADIDVSPPIAAGSVRAVRLPRASTTAAGEAAEFDPARWERESARTMNFIPFGVSANRPCPARGVAPVGMQAAAREVLRRFTLSSTAQHTRSLANRAPVFLTPVGAPGPSPGPAGPDEARRPVGRRVAQPRAAVLGTFMVWDARRLALCRTYFAQHPEHLPGPPRPRTVAATASSPVGSLAPQPPVTERRNHVCRRPHDPVLPRGRRHPHRLQARQPARRPGRAAPGRRRDDRRASCSARHCSAS